VCEPVRNISTRARGTGRSRHGRGSSHGGRAGPKHGRRNFTTANGIPAEISVNRRKPKKTLVDVKWTCRVCNTENSSHKKPCDGCGKKFDLANDSYSQRLLRPSNRGGRKHHNKIISKRNGKRHVVGKRKGNKPKGPRNCKW